jgi:hypothetical protein
MATQAIISIVKDNEVMFKCVAGCNGMTAPETAKELKTLKNPTLDEVYAICLKNDFGCDDCLIVQGKNEHKDKYGEELSELYKSKFNDAQFNPRWECGLASYVEVIECGG